MAEILRYVLVDENNRESEYEYATMQEAIDQADPNEAVIERTYTYDDSQLVWTPDGSNVWPPRRRQRQDDE